MFASKHLKWRATRGSNPGPLVPETNALSTELVALIKAGNEVMNLKCNPPKYLHAHISSPGALGYHRRDTLSMEP